MFESSSEFGDHEGLGVIPGRIDKFETNRNPHTPLAPAQCGLAADQPRAGH